jgi:hypothetical protein
VSELLNIVTPLLYTLNHGVFTFLGEILRLGVSGCYLTSNEQQLGYIMARTSYIQCNDDIRFVLD